MAGQTERRISRTLLEHYPRTYGAEVGLGSLGTPSRLFQLLVLSMLMGARIRASVALEAAQALFDHKWTRAGTYDSHERSEDGQLCSRSRNHVVFLPSAPLANPTTSLSQLSRGKRCDMEGASASPVAAGQLCAVTDGTSSSADSLSARLVSNGAAVFGTGGKWLAACFSIASASTTTGWATSYTRARSVRASTGPRWSSYGGAWSGWDPPGRLLLLPPRLVVASTGRAQNSWCR